MRGVSGRTDRAAFQSQIHVSGHFAATPPALEHALRCPLAELDLTPARSGHRHPCDLTQEDLRHV